MLVICMILVCEINWLGDGGFIDLVECEIEVKVWLICLFVFVILWFLFLIEVEVEFLIVEEGVSFG